jgi:GAF domain-containing protein
MPFSVGLQQSLFVRDCQAVHEISRGDSLEEVLGRHLLAVEAMAETEIITSILLLSSDGKRLSHCAGPNLPKSYRDAIDGSEIGPRAGSCGTAAFFARSVYVEDIATDPLWADYRELALGHGLRSCWSTPIRGPHGSVVGTFAIYHRSSGRPTNDELEAIELITGRVARAITRAATEGSLETFRKGSAPRLIVDNARNQEDNSINFLLIRAARLERIADEIQEQSTFTTEAMEAVLRDSRKLAKAIRKLVSLI